MKKMMTTNPITGGQQRHHTLCLVVPVLLALIVSGCARHEPEMVRVPEPLERPVVDNTEPASPGSLWTGDEDNWIGDLRAHHVGDIVTVLITEKASASKESTTETGRDSSITAGIPTFFGLEKKVVEGNPDLDPSKLIEANMKNDFKGSGKTTRKENLVATLTAQVIKVYPNGNMKIRGGKSVVVNNENQIIYLTGIIRPWDVNAANEVDSSKILNAQIAYTGKGIISDKQKPGWLGRIVDNLWPF